MATYTKTVMHCDRCNRREEVDENYNIYNWYVILNTPKNQYDYSKINSDAKDLCKKCNEEFFVWWGKSVH